MVDLAFISEIVKSQYPGRINHWHKVAEGGGKGGGLPTSSNYYAISYILGDISLKIGWEVLSFIQLSLISATSEDLNMPLL